MGDYDPLKQLLQHHAGCQVHGVLLDDHLVVFRRA